MLKEYVMFLTYIKRCNSICLHTWAIVNQN